MCGFTPMSARQDAALGPVQFQYLQNIYICGQVCLKCVTLLSTFEWKGSCRACENLFAVGLVSDDERQWIPNQHYCRLRP